MAVEVQQTTEKQWRQPALTGVSCLAALALLILSVAGQWRLMSEIGHPFGGFFWGEDASGRPIVLATLAQFPQFSAAVDPIWQRRYLSAVEVSDPRQVGGLRVYRGPQALTQAFAQTRPGMTLTYLFRDERDGRTVVVSGPAVPFTWEMWWLQYGLALLAGLSWLLLAVLLLLKATDWGEAVEGLTLLPPALLLLLVACGGNVQRPSAFEPLILVLWLPGLALTGSALLHLSLSYRAEVGAASVRRAPAFTVDGLAYLPLLVVFAFEISAQLLYGSVPLTPALLLALSIALLTWLVAVGCALPLLLAERRCAGSGRQPLTARTRPLAALLLVRLGGPGLGLILGLLLLSGQALVPWPALAALAALYPLVIWFAGQASQERGRLRHALAQHEEQLQRGREREHELEEASEEMRRSLSLLLRADRQLRATLARHIHDRPQQQALRIRSLLGYWHHRLKVEAEDDPQGRVGASPFLEALEQVRRIGDELQRDLRTLQLLVEDVYQRQSLGLRQHLEKVIREDVPAMFPESPLKIETDLRALDLLERHLEQSEAEERMAEAIAYAVTQAVLNIYQHAGASFATVRSVRTDGHLEIYVIDDGRGFDSAAIPPERTSLLQARLKVREAGGVLSIHSITRPHSQHGTTVALRFPLIADQPETTL